MRRYLILTATIAVSLNIAPALAGMITVENDDHADLYVTVWDRNTSNSKEVIKDRRINDGDQLPIQVEIDGSGNAKVGWRAYRDGEPDKAKTVESEEVGENDLLRVDTLQ